jgi:hypothetical protein
VPTELIPLIIELLKLIPEIQELIQKKKEDTEVRTKLIVLLEHALELWEKWAPLSREKQKEYGAAVQGIITEIETLMKQIREKSKEIRNHLDKDEVDKARLCLEEIRTAANTVRGMLTSLRVFQALDKARQKNANVKKSM